VQAVNPSEEEPVKVRIKVQPSGLLNDRAWPEVGEEIDVPDVVGADLCSSGVAVPVAEKASEKSEKAVAKKSAEKRA
jgi:hypothetical protein